MEGAHAATLAAFYRVEHKVCRLDFIAQHFHSDLLSRGGDIPEGHYADPSMALTVVPFRNGIMLSLAAGYAESIGAEEVIIGNHAGDHPIYPDCRIEFIEAMNQATRAGTYLGVRITSPFVLVSKAYIVHLGHQLGVPMELTYSCYKGGEAHCGKCGTCVERREAFALAGVADPTHYEGEDEEMEDTANVVPE